MMEKDFLLDWSLRFGVCIKELEHLFNKYLFMIQEINPKYNESKLYSLTRNILINTIMEKQHPPKILLDNDSEIENEYFLKYWSDLSGKSVRKLHRIFEQYVSFLRKHSIGLCEKKLYFLARIHTVNLLLNHPERKEMELDAKDFKLRGEK